MREGKRVKASERSKERVREDTDGGKDRKGASKAHTGHKCAQRLNNKTKDKEEKGQKELPKT